MSGGEDQPTRGSERVPIEARVDLEFESFQGFLSEYSSNISLGGIFVQTSQPPPVGTVLKFSLKLKGNFNLVQGRGEVVWIRPEGDGGGPPPGAGIRFLDLEPASKDLIRRMVDRHKVQGGSPFVLERPKGVADALEAAVPRADPGDPLQDDIFVPPDLPLAQQAPSKAAVPGKVPPSSKAGAPLRRRRRFRTASLLIGAAILGGLTAHYGEGLVGWAMGYDKALVQRVVYDVPPPASLASRVSGPRVAAEDPRIEGPPDRGVTPAEAGVTDLGPGPASVSLENSWVTLGEDYGLAEEELSRIRLITWKEATDGKGTVITLWGNGNLRRENITKIRLGGQPARELIKVKGIDWPFRDPVVEVESSVVRRIRTGFHPKETLNELHIVVDLKDSQSELRSAELGGRSIELFFHR